MGVIGSELEGLLKQHILGEDIQICCSVVRDEKEDQTSNSSQRTASPHIPKTRRLQELMDKACAASNTLEAITFSNGITIPTNEFVLTMLDGPPVQLQQIRQNGLEQSDKGS